MPVSKTVWQAKVHLDASISNPKININLITLEVETDLGLRNHVHALLKYLFGPRPP